MFCQQAEVPAHLLRQYIATQQLAPSAQATQVLPRPTHLQGQAPARLVRYMKFWVLDCMRTSVLTKLLGSCMVVQTSGYCYTLSVTSICGLPYPHSPSNLKSDPPWKNEVFWKSDLMHFRILLCRNEGHSLSHVRWGFIYKVDSATGCPRFNPSSSKINVSWYWDLQLCFLVPISTATLAPNNSNLFLNFSHLIFFQPYAVQNEQQYQPAPQYQPQYRPQYQAQPVQYQRPQQQETRDPQEDYDVSFFLYLK